MQFDIDAIMALKNSFQGQKFQMVRGKGPKLGKVFEVVDIEPSRGGYFGMLNDGSKISIDTLNSNFMMLMDDQPPMSMAEIMSINDDYGQPINSTEKIAPDLQIPDELKSELSVPTPQVNAPAPQISAPAQQINAPAQRVSAPATTTDLFGMFSLEETALSITVKVQLPNKSLLKAMYQNSQNQSEFIDKLSSHINNGVTADSIKDSLWKMLDPEKKKQLNDKSSKD